MTTKRSKKEEPESSKSPFFRRIRKGQMGGPRFVLSDDGVKEVENLASIGCIKSEIAVMLGCSENTLSSEDNKPLFDAAYKRGQARLDISLRRSMVKKAINKDNTQMQIFLAKNRLGMSDNPSTVQGEAENDPAWVEEQNERAHKESRPREMGRGLELREHIRLPERLGGSCA